MLYSSNYPTNFKFRTRRVERRDNIDPKLRLNFNLKFYNLWLPPKLNYLIYKNSFRKKYIIKIFSSVYFFHFAVPLGYVYPNFNTYTSILSFYNNNRNPYLNQWVLELNNILFLFLTFLFIKLKFRGKGYYIYKNRRNTVTPQFGYSHRIYIYSFFNIVRFITKTKLLIFGLHKGDILRTALLTKKYRSINIFTGRGVRFSNELVYKKTGKVSSYR